MKHIESLRTLLLRAKSGDAAAQSEIIERFRPLIKKYARQAAIEDAYDVEQELVLRLLLLIRSYREELPYGFMELVERERTTR
ncbi:helix-turn-helix domain-containing protein [Tumebacillus sp. DT12]|uniref:Helix-turn-helix domain-containing protein n=1 Tax=Tumebacillus lacus TaxID=2995335 RepID=A0ABT3X4R9_9BACL|nr:helix-turn-helix domain-containing protein [Tumebacillus lacus]MCX7570580.1 helix-turn-helix domain-containing protein [Tumebacillus lacus]